MVLQPVSQHAVGEGTQAVAVQFADLALVVLRSRHQASLLRRSCFDGESGEVTVEGAGDGVLAQGQSCFLLLLEPVRGLALQLRQFDAGVVLGHRRAIVVATDDLFDGLLERRADEIGLGIDQTFEQGRDAGLAHADADQFELSTGALGEQQVARVGAMLLAGLALQLLGLVGEVVQGTEGVDGLLGEHGVTFVVDA